MLIGLDVPVFGDSRRAIDLTADLFEDYIKS